LFEVANPDGQLMTQMSAQVFFIVASVKNAVTVPVAALHPVKAAEPSASAAAPATADGTDAKPYSVRVLGANGKESRREVWVGVMNRVSAEVLAGLEPGEIVVISRAGTTAEGGADPATGNRRTGGNRNPMGRIL
jgi:macrolide-specific efflux system membrane fusion protein